MGERVCPIMAQGWLSNENDNEIIMADSDEAAEYRTNICGWVSRHGNYYGKDERMARYDGATHNECPDCKEPIEQVRARCVGCQNIADITRYNKKEHKEWDGKTPLYSEWLNEYIFDDPHEFLDEQIANGGVECDIGDLRLRICEPKQLSQIDEDHWCDDLPEDYDLPADAAGALKAFNEALNDVGTVSWWPGKYRTSINNQKGS